MFFPLLAGKTKNFLSLILCLVMIFALVGCSSSAELDVAGSDPLQSDLKAETNQKNPELKLAEASPIVPKETQQQQVVIYRLTRDGRYLLPITRTVKIEGNPVEAALKELVEWEDEWSKPLLPEKIKLGKVEIQREIAVIDLVGDFSKLNIGADQEAKIVEGLTRTATQFPYARQALILLNGKAAETLSGHVAIDKPLAFDKYLNVFANRQGEETKIQLYFSDPDAMYMVPVTYSVPKTVAVIKTAVELLIQGPRQPGLKKTIPKGTKLIDVSLEKGIVYVNFSREIRDNHWGGSSGESATISSLVYTLTSLPGVEKVQILIEGKTGQSIAGHVILDAPFGRGSINFRG